MEWEEFTGFVIDQVSNERFVAQNAQVAPNLVLHCFSYSSVPTFCIIIEAKVPIFVESNS